MNIARGTRETHELNYLCAWIWRLVHVRGHQGNDEYFSKPLLVLPLTLLPLDECEISSRSAKIGAVS